MTHEPCAVVVALFFLSCVYEFCMILASNFTVGCALFTSPPRQDPTLVRENGPPRNRDPPRRSRQSWSRHCREKCDHRCLIGWLESPPPARGGLLVSCYLLPVYMYAVHAISSLDTEGSLRHGTQTAWGFVGTCLIFYAVCMLVLFMLFMLMLFRLFRLLARSTLVYP